jgi:hypothetical protein
MCCLPHREGPAAQESAETVLALATAQGFHSAGLGAHGGGRDRTGDCSDVPGHRAWPALATSVVLALYLATLAEVCGQVGQLGDAPHLLIEARTPVDTIRERYREAEVYRLQGELLLQASRGKTGAAEESFHHALDVARRQQARFPNGGRPRA